jgi:hypothetical protein
VLGLLRKELLGLVGLGPSLQLAALDLIADAELAEGAELEARVLGEVLLPVVHQQVEVGDEGVPPLLDRLVERLGDPGLSRRHDGS